jgi:hypothetical protein
VEGEGEQGASVSASFLLGVQILGVWGSVGDLRLGLEDLSRDLRWIHVRVAGDPNQKALGFHERKCMGYNCDYVEAL